MINLLRRERYSVSALRVHLICVTKYRGSVFTAESLAVIEKIFLEVAQKTDCKIEEFNREADHIHVLIEYPPKLSISQLVNYFKGVSSRQYGQAGFKKPYGKEALWSSSYFVSSVEGTPIEILKAYIRNQDRPTA